MNKFTIKDHSNNDCIIFLPEEEIENETIDIINKLSKCNVFNNIRIMPDCHSSVNCCVGFTCQIKDKVIPNIVGGDIGCGISCYNLKKKIKEKQYKKIDNIIKNTIPLGSNIQKISLVNENIMNNIYKKCNSKLELLKEKYPKYNFKNFNDVYYQNLIDKMDCKKKSKIFMRSLGTLGGGNHYIEFNESELKETYVTVHSGSRAIGLEICRYHQKKAKHNKNDKLLDTYLEGDDMIEYLIDMIFAQVYASKNRELIIQLICREMNIEYDNKNLIETIHNYIDFERFILRKGAISADKDKKCLISLNMRDGLLLCNGKGCPEWNYSSAHGCGRLMSRGEARKIFNMKDFHKEMSDVYSSSICKETLDESPMAYKDSEMIKKYIGDSVEILNQLKPIINIKGF